MHNNTVDGCLKKVGHIVFIQLYWLLKQKIRKLQEIIRINKLIQQTLFPPCE